VDAPDGRSTVASHAAVEAEGIPWAVDGDVADADAAVDAAAVAEAGVAVVAVHPGFVLAVGSRAAVVTCSDPAATLDTAHCSVAPGAAGTCTWAAFEVKGKSAAKDRQRAVVLTAGRWDPPYWIAKSGMGRANMAQN
jgi:hypothetical protein